MNIWNSERWDDFPTHLIRSRNWAKSWYLGGSKPLVFISETESKINFYNYSFSKSERWTIPAEKISSNNIKAINPFSCHRDHKRILPSENLLYLIPWGWMLMGLSALFLKWTFMVSPTSAYRVGPRSPEMLGRGFSFLKCGSYSL